MQEIETVKEHCKHEDCYYRRRIGSRTKDDGYCNYACMEHMPRGCKISECDKYKPQAAERRPHMNSDFVIEWKDVNDDPVYRQTDRGNEPR